MNQPSPGGPLPADRIIVSRIALFAYHGLHAEEAKLGQRFFISLDVGLDLREAGRNDDWNSTACYAGMTETVQSVGTGQRFNTLEGLAEAIASALLATVSRLVRVTVRVEKPAAPIPAIIDNVAVEITRFRPGA
ncbi:dihydroneopterin aldolase [Pseudochelatococcus lubricantis]|uniref:dihydroneopterin aldolase n=1 Tax=Pseudochelatococcus lubricantis TaxID=1538102 RepID=UPI0035E61353